jgi:hypothetical protein
MLRRFEAISKNFSIHARVRGICWICPQTFATYALRWPENKRETGVRARKTQGAGDSIGDGNSVKTRSSMQLSAIPIP